MRMAKAKKATRTKKSAKAAKKSGGKKPPAKKPVKKPARGSAKPSKARKPAKKPAAKKSNVRRAPARPRQTEPSSVGANVVNVAPVPQEPIESATRMPEPEITETDESWDSEAAM